MQYFTFNYWRLYILNNGGSINYNKQLRSKKVNTTEQFNINPSIFNHVSKSPLSQAYKLLRDITLITHHVFTSREPSVLKPPPTYEVLFHQCVL